METRKSSSADDVNTYANETNIGSCTRSNRNSTEKVKAARTKEKCTKTISKNNRFSYSHFGSFCMRAHTHTYTVLDDCHQNMANRSNLAGQKIDTHTHTCARDQNISFSRFFLHLFRFTSTVETSGTPFPSHSHSCSLLISMPPLFFMAIEIHVFPSSPNGIQCAFSYINIIIWQQRGIVHVLRVRVYTHTHTHNGIHM